MMSDSKKVFELRREKKLGEAYNLAIKLYNQEPYDEWVQKAYAWVLIDIVKEELYRDTNNAQAFFYQLESIDFVDVDEIITKQINYLKPKFDKNYNEIQRAENNSKNGKHKEALSIFKQLKEQGRLSENHHEAYGWVIYRYIKANENNLSTNEIKKNLFLYLGLKNPKPELLHSVILQFTISYAHKHQDFNLYKFFELWNPLFLRDEDKCKQYKDEKIYPSLVEKLIRVVLEQNYPFDINYLQNSIGDKELIIEIIRENYFWKLFNLHKNNRLQDLWRIFDYYVSTFSIYGVSHWHSEILKIADRFMIEDNSWRFFIFFQKWGIENFQHNDWEYEINGEFKNKPIVIKALKKIFELSKLPSSQNHDFNWILPLYEEALKKFNDDIWILREYATLLNKVGDNRKAIELYKKIVLELSDQAYIWSEFSKLLSSTDIEVAISMLCKAISIQKNEDFLGDIHLNLAKLLIEKDKLIEAKTELTIYKMHREKKGWKLSDEFNILYNQLDEIEEKNNNSSFYRENINLCEEYIYSDIPWTDLLVIDKWKTKENKERIVFSDLNDIEFVINPFKFKLLKDAQLHEVYKFKLFYEKENERYIPLIASKSSLLKQDLINTAPLDIAIVDHVNLQKKLFHYVISRLNDGIVKFSQTKIRPEVGDFIEIRYFKRFNKKRNEYKTTVLETSLSDKMNSSLAKSTSGLLSLKYKNEWNDVADFGFVNDYYVSKKLLKKYKIEEDCMVEAKVLFNGEKWNVYNIKLLE